MGFDKRGFLLTRKDKLLEARELTLTTGKKVVIRHGKVEVWDGEDQQGDIVVYFKDVNDGKE